ncbi:hypothetical protein OAT84_02500 [Gammaproteobacteria bacterium]|nr:hypothetical protein [Gammaproteobacteria bacterium]
MQNFKSLRRFVFEALDTYQGIKGQLHQRREAQLNGLKNFCQIQKQATDDAIRRYIDALLIEIEIEHQSRWSLFHKKIPSRLAQLLKSALECFDRQQNEQVRPMQFSQEFSQIGSRFPVLSIEN